MKTTKKQTSSKTNSRRPAARTSVKRSTKTINKSAKKTVSSKTTPVNSRRANSIASLNNGIAILRNAIQNNISVSAAAKASGRGRNYISDIKARIEENFKSNNISKTLYNTFNSLSTRYDKKSSK